MVATVSIYYDFGGTDAAPGTEQDVDALGPPTIRFKVADDATIDTNNPMPIPAAGTNYSYWKQLYLYCDVAPATQIDNVKFYTDGTNSLGTGVDVKIGLEFPSKTNAAAAGYEVADTTTVMTTGHTGVTTSASIFNYTSGSPLSLTIGEAGGIINAIGETTNYFVLQMEVASTASPGGTASETCTIQYDEI